MGVLTAYCLTEPVKYSIFAVNRKGFKSWYLKVLCLKRVEGMEKIERG